MASQPVRKAGLSALAGKSSPSTTRAKGFYAKDREGESVSESNEGEERRGEEEECKSGRGVQARAGREGK
jgi:hypothetical protein